MPITTYSRGHGWTDVEPNDLPPEDAEQYVRSVLLTFHETCRRLGRPDLHWYPKVGELRGELERGAPTFDPSRLRDICVDVLWDEINDILAEGAPVDWSDRILGAFADELACEE